MPVPQARRDGYGRPLPELADARHEVLKDTPQNQDLRKMILALLEEHYAALLRRGIFADVALTFLVRDGRIQPDMDVVVTKQYRHIQGSSDGRAR
jgi:hypothetical protein